MLTMALRPFPLTFPATLTEDWQLLRVYVLPVVLAFAEEACALGQHATNPWFSDRIDFEVRGYLNRLVEAAGSEYSRRSNRRITGMPFGGVIHADVWCEIENALCCYAFCAALRASAES